MVRIRILHGYRGRPTKERFYPPGEYEFEDALAAYLVENKHAVYVESEYIIGIDPATPDGDITAIHALVTPNIGELREAWYLLTGKKAFNGWDAETLAKKLAKLSHD